MARKSAAALSVVTGLPGQRLEAPERLTEEESDVWRQVAASKPHDWFTTDTAPLLEAYCRAVVSHRLVSRQVATYNLRKLNRGSGLKTYDVLTRVQEREVRLMASIATKLRLTNQSRYTPSAAGTAAKKVRGARPWES